MFAPGPAATSDARPPRWCPPARCGTAHREPIGMARQLVNLAGAGLLAAAWGCAARGGTPPAAQPRPEIASERPAGGIVLRVRLAAGTGGEVVTLPLEQYVAGTIAAEVAVGTLPRDIAILVLQLQALVARTYAMANLGRHAGEGFDLC